jgi:hypothetical protein
LAITAGGVQWLHTRRGTRALHPVDTPHLPKHHLISCWLHLTRLVQPKRHCTHPVRPKEHSTHTRQGPRGAHTLSWSLWHPQLCQTDTLHAPARGVVPPAASNRPARGSCVAGIDHAPSGAGMQQGCAIDRGIGQLPPNSRDTHCLQRRGVASHVLRCVTHWLLEPSCSHTPPPARCCPSCSELLLTAAPSSETGWLYERDPSFGVMRRTVVSAQGVESPVTASRGRGATQHPQQQPCVNSTLTAYMPCEACGTG